MCGLNLQGLQISLDENKSNFQATKNENLKMVIEVIWYIKTRSCFSLHDPLEEYSVFWVL